MKVIAFAGGKFVRNQALSSAGPWVTGIVTVYDAGIGAAITTTTQTGRDSRSAFNTGTVSLVTPRLQFVYQGDGSGSLLSARDAFSVVHQLTVEFLPEPTHWVMMFSVLVGF